MAPFTLQTLKAGEADQLSPLAPDVFDNPIDPATARAFLANPDNRLIVARDGELIIGFVSATRLIHPDKPGGELFIQEVGTAPDYQRKGVASALMRALFEEARAMGCKLAWLAVDTDNEGALAFYEAIGGKPPERQFHIDFDLE
ncbi:GNAT family N-acetyltransferase [Hyphobacterium sp.]|uniref:GNAT family N-acetyltransferase n=1 Tax=Hyphobacterium sp. TaxID=2004662 RepID=UPI003BACDE22